MANERQPLSIGDVAGIPFALSAFVQPRLGEILKEIRLQRGLSLRETAAESGVATTTWHRAECGEDLRVSRVVRMFVWALSYRP